MVSRDGMRLQVPIAHREKLLIRGGVDPRQLKNLRLVYNDPQVKHLALQSTSSQVEAHSALLLFFVACFVTVYYDWIMTWPIALCCMRILMKCALSG